MSSQFELPPTPTSATPKSSNARPFPIYNNSSSSSSASLPHSPSTISTSTIPTLTTSLRASLPNIQTSSHLSDPIHLEPDAAAAASSSVFGTKIRRSSSIRSNRRSASPVLPSPLADFQSDHVLNAPSKPPKPLSHPASPVPGPVTHVGMPVNPVQLDYRSSDRVPLSPKSDQQEQVGLHESSLNSPVSPQRRPTFSAPPVRAWNPFIPPGVEGWTRESWGKRKIALISGITGQDGSYLTEILLSKGYTVHGIIRRSSSFNTSRLHHLFSSHHDGEPRMILHYGDLTDSTNLVYIISQVQPSEIYNLGAQSHVKVSFEMAEYTGNVDGIGTLRLLDAIRTCGLDKLVRFYQASTSEMYGQVRETPQNEHTPFYPRSPYGCAKLYAYWTVVNYREAYGMFACNGILFNHESPRRGRTFVTRKITRAVAEISLGKQECMFMGNLDAMRDWGHARDYCEGMWRILQHDQPEDWVLASGESHSVREFIEKSFDVVGIHLEWSGKGVEEIGSDERSGRVLVRVDPAYFRPAEVDHLLGDANKAETLLGWKRTIGFDELIREMVLADLASAKDLVEDHN